MACEHDFRIIATLPGYWLKRCKACGFFIIQERETGKIIHSVDNRRTAKA